MVFLSLNRVSLPADTMERGTSTADMMERETSTVEASH